MGQCKFTCLCADVHDMILQIANHIEYGIINIHSLSTASTYRVPHLQTDGVRMQSHTMRMMACQLLLVKHHQKNTATKRSIRRGRYDPLASMDMGAMKLR